MANTPVPPGSLLATSGTPQSAEIIHPFADMVVTALDSNNQPVSGLTVTFAAPNNGATGAFVGGINTAVTDAMGVAHSPTFISNGTTGGYVISASVAGLASTAQFSLTNTPISSGPLLSAGAPAVGQNLQTAVLISLPCAPNPNPPGPCVQDTAPPGGLR